MLRTVALAASAGLAGCATRRRTGGRSPRSPARVTTSSVEGVDILTAQIAIAADAAGPDAFYRLHNRSDREATVRVETRLSIDAGGTYSAFAVVTIPPGDEVTVRYRIVRFADLSEAEQTRVRRGDGVDFETFVNGQRRRV